MAMLGSGGIYVGLEEGKSEEVGRSGTGNEVKVPTPSACFTKTLASTE
jgi:hypothetical protein